MREQGPVYHDKTANAWCVLDYDLVEGILRDSDNFSSKHLAYRAEPVLGARVLAQMQGEEHDQKKAVAMRGIATVAMDGYYLPAIEKTVKELWEQVDKETIVDLAHELSSPFSSNVTCKLLGIPAHNQKRSSLGIKASWSSSRSCTKARTNVADGSQMLATSKPSCSA